MACSLDLENSVACRMTQDNVSLSVSRRIARHAFTPGYHPPGQVFTQMLSLAAHRKISRQTHEEMPVPPAENP